MKKMMFFSLLLLVAANARGSTISIVNGTDEKIKVQLFRSLPSFEWKFTVDPMKMKTKTGNFFEIIATTSQGETASFRTKMTKNGFEDMTGSFRFFRGPGKEFTDDFDKKDVFQVKRFKVHEIN